jgi:hypothetical protein
VRKSRKGRLTLFPQVPLVIGDTVLFQQRQKLLLKRHLPVVRLLVPDVLDDLFQLRNADTECAILYLPSKEPVLWKSVMHPFRRAALDELQRLAIERVEGRARRMCTWSGMPPISIAVI